MTEGCVLELHVDDGCGVGVRVPGWGARFVVVVRHAAILALALVLLWGVVLVRVCAETPVASCTRVSVKNVICGRWTGA